MESSESNGIDNVVCYICQDPEDEENFNNFWIPFVNAMGLVNAEGGPFIDYTYVSFLVF